MALQVVSVARIFLPRLLLISKSNSRPAKLTIWQDLRDDGDQEITFIILCAPSPRHDGTGTQPAAPRKPPNEGERCGIKRMHSLEGEGHALWRGGGIEALPLEGGGSGGGTEMGWPKF
jgi:hypothetical protein